MPHIHDLIDFTVAVFIVHNKKVLLVHHKKLNMWLPIGGHVELNEDTDQALLREIKEECGLEVEVIGEKQPNFKVEGTKFLHKPMFMNIHDINETHKHIVHIYFAKAKSEAFIHNKEEHNDIRWFTKEDLDKPEFNLNAAVKFYATEALNKII
ncbi:MAG: NUDIX domain-containing protein [Candidatus Staskawiczbacteria bacterium]|nr:NUDIX domain-containing protein [Candidatus Staskawiczbacteria bacterium]